jgi:hypothetical protein
LANVTYENAAEILATEPIYPLGSLAPETSGFITYEYQVQAQGRAVRSVAFLRDLMRRKPELADEVAGSGLVLTVPAGRPIAGLDLMIGDALGVCIRAG